MSARDYRPICPQLNNYMFDEIHNGYAQYAIKTDENCLFLNIWTPQVYTINFINNCVDRSQYIYTESYHMLRFSQPY